MEELTERKMPNKDQSRLRRDEARSIGSECRVGHQARQESQVLPLGNRGCVGLAPPTAPGNPQGSRF